jgi:hypothetical protein
VRAAVNVVRSLSHQARREGTHKRCQGKAGAERATECLAGRPANMESALNGDSGAQLRIIGEIFQIVQSRVASKRLIVL